VLAANVFLDFDLDFAVGETADQSLAERNAEVLYDSLREFRVGIAGKYHQAFDAHSGHLSCYWGALRHRQCRQRISACPLWTL
jgi:hypothetical protein